MEDCRPRTLLVDRLSRLVVSVSDPLVWFAGGLVERIEQCDAVQGKVGRIT